VSGLNKGLLTIHSPSLHNKKCLLITSRKKDKIFQGNCFEIGKDKEGKAIILKGESESGGHITHISSKGTYSEMCIGTVYVVEEDRYKVETISSGQGCLYGDDYHIYTTHVAVWKDFLVVIKPEYPVRFLVTRTGEWYSHPTYWVVFLDENEIRVVRREEANSFEEDTKVVLPDIKGFIWNKASLVELSKL